MLAVLYISYTRSLHLYYHTCIVLCYDSMTADKIQQMQTDQWDRKLEICVAVHFGCSYESCLLTEQMSDTYHNMSAC